VVIQENKDPFNWIPALQLTLSLAMTAGGTPPIFLRLLFCHSRESGDLK
jgi:hypothetical protein